MNNYFKILLAGTVGIVTMSSCNKDDDPQQGVTGKRWELLIGKWKTTYAGESPDKLVPVEEEFAYLDEYLPNGEGTSTFFGDDSVERFEWMMPEHERFVRYIRQYEGIPDTAYLEFHSFEKNRFVVKDTSFNSVIYAVFERQ